MGQGGQELGMMEYGWKKVRVLNCGGGWVTIVLGGIDVGFFAPCFDGAMSGEEWMVLHEPAPPFALGRIKTAYKLCEPVPEGRLLRFD